MLLPRELPRVYSFYMDNRPTIAIMYDFDKTLTTRAMQEYSFIPNLGMEAAAFWGKANELARKEGMDSVLAYMKLMLDEAKRHDQPIRRGDFVSLGRTLEFYPGVEAWFDHVNELGRELGLRIEHFIISSGLTEIIEGSAIGSRFKKIYACEYYYDVNGVAKWPKLAINYTAKTQFLFRINKGILDVWEDNALNDYTPQELRPVPFANMIYIGDGLTDVPCMKLVKESGGISIAVHAKGEVDLCHRLMAAGRINFFIEADYTPQGGLFALMKKILARMSSANALEKTHLLMKKEAMSHGNKGHHHQ